MVMDVCIAAEIKKQQAAVSAICWVINLLVEGFELLIFGLII